MLDKISSRSVARALLATLAVAAAGLSTAPRAAAAPTTVAPVEPWLAGELAKAGARTAVPVLVGAGSVGAATAAIREAGAEPVRTFERVGFAVTLATPSQVEQIRRAPDVRYLQGNRPLGPTGTTAQQTTRVVQAEQVFDAPDGGALDGSGVGIAVVDSGMAGDHPMYRDAGDTGTRLLNIKQVCVDVFECNVPGEVNDAFFLDATGLDTDATAAGGHGTHVASIAGGREVTTSDGVVVRGTATASSLYGLGAGAGIFTINAAASLNWVLEHHADPCAAFTPRPAVVGGCAPIRVVNNSYGSPDDYSPSDVFAILSERLVLEGVVVVWAAGNGDDATAAQPRPNDGTVNLSNPPGQSPLPGVLMVANYDDKGAADRDNALNTSSSRGLRGKPDTYPDLAAPGTSILAACKPYLPICTTAEPDPNYGAISGTSMAAPHVAGVVALLLEAHPELTPAQVEDLLEDTAHQFGDPSSYEADVASATAPQPGLTRNGDHLTSFDKGHGLVDLTAAIAAAEGLPDPGPDGTNPCAGYTVMTDEEGDARAATGIGPNVTPPLPTPDVDMTSARLHVLEAAAPAAANDIRLTITVTDLPDSPRSAGDSVRSFFGIGTTAYTLDTRRDPGANGPTSRGTLSVPDAADPTGTGSVVVASGFPVVFDADADELRVDLPGSVLGVGEGDAFVGFRALWRRSGAAVAVPADEMSGVCPLLITAADGNEPIVPEAPLPVLLLVLGLGLGLGVVALRRRALLGPAAAVLIAAAIVGGSVVTAPTRADAETREAVAFGTADGTFEDDIPVASLRGGEACVTVSGDKATNDPATAEGCTVVPFTVPATPQPLRFLEAFATPTNAGAGANDLDVYVLAADGTVVGSAATAFPLGPSTGTESTFVQGLAPGSYRFVIQAYATGPDATARIGLRWWVRDAFVD